MEMQNEISESDLQRKRVRESDKESNFDTAKHQKKDPSIIQVSHEDEKNNIKSPTKKRALNTNSKTKNLQNSFNQKFCPSGAFNVENDMFESSRLSDADLLELSSSLMPPETPLYTKDICYSIIKDNSIQEDRKSSQSSVSTLADEHTALDKMEIPSKETMNDKDTDLNIENPSFYPNEQEKRIKLDFSRQGRNPIEEEKDVLNSQDQNIAPCSENLNFVVNPQIIQNNANEYDSYCIEHDNADEHTSKDNLIDNSDCSKSNVNNNCHFSHHQFWSEFHNYLVSRDICISKNLNPATDEKLVFMKGSNFFEDQSRNISLIPSFIMLQKLEKAFESLILPKVSFHDILSLRMTNKSLYRLVGSSMTYLNYEGLRKILSKIWMREEKFKSEFTFQIEKHRGMEFIIPHSLAPFHNELALDNSCRSLDLSYFRNVRVLHLPQTSFFSHNELDSLPYLCHLTFNTSESLNSLTSSRDYPQIETIELLSSLDDQQSTQNLTPSSTSIMHLADLFQNCFSKLKSVSLHADYESLIAYLKSLRSRKKYETLESLCVQKDSNDINLNMNDITINFPSLKKIEYLSGFSVTEQNPEIQFSKNCEEFTWCLSLPLNYASLQLPSNLTKLTLELDGLTFLRLETYPVSLKHVKLYGPFMSIQPLVQALESAPKLEEMLLGVKVPPPESVHKIVNNNNNRLPNRMIKKSSRVHDNISNYSDLGFDDSGIMENDIEANDNNKKGPIFYSKNSFNQNETNANYTDNINIRNFENRDLNQKNPNFKNDFNNDPIELSQYNLEINNLNVKNISLWFEATADCSHTHPTSLSVVLKTPLLKKIIADHSPIVRIEVLYFTPVCQYLRSVEIKSIISPRLSSQTPCRLPYIPKSLRKLVIPPQVRIDPRNFLDITSKVSHHLDLHLFNLDHPLSFQNSLTTLNLTVREPHPRDSWILRVCRILPYLPNLTDLKLKTKESQNTPYWPVHISSNSLRRISIIPLKILNSCDNKGNYFGTCRVFQPNCKCSGFTPNSTRTKCLTLFCGHSALDHSPTVKSQIPSKTLNLSIQCPNLIFLSISWCSNLFSIPQTLLSCPKLEELIWKSSSSLRYLTLHHYSLRILHIKYVDSLESLTLICPKLVELSLLYCPKISRILPVDTPILELSNLSNSVAKNLEPKSYSMLSLCNNKRVLIRKII